MLSRNLEKSLHRALALATEHRHEYATLEHLLLALIEDEDTVPLLRACGVDLDRLRREVLNYIDNELANLVTTNGDDAKPTAGLQRVLQRAAIHVQASGCEEVTGANVVVAMFAERESHAVYFLQAQDMTRFDAVNYMSHGTAKVSGLSVPRPDQPKPKTASQGHGMDFRASADRLNQRRGFSSPEIDETKIIAAILCARTTLPDDDAGDPVKKIVDMYERILTELRARGHGGQEVKTPPKGSRGVNAG